MAGTESLLRAAWRAEKKLPLVLLLLLLVNVGLLVGMKTHLRPQLETLERTYIARQTELRQHHAEGRRIQEPQEELWMAQADLERFRQAIPERQHLSQLIGELFTLAEDAGLTIEQVKYDPEKLPDHSLLRYVLGFSVSGQYAQLKRFVYSLEQSDRLVAIESVALSSDSEPTQGQVNLRLRLATLFRMGVL